MLNSPTSKIIAGVIACSFLVLLGTGVWAVMNVPQENGQQPNGNEDPYAGWRTYISEEFKFEVKYPSNWAVLEERTDGTLVKLGDPEDNINENSLWIYSGRTARDGFNCYKTERSDTIQIQNEGIIAEREILSPKEYEEDVFGGLIPCNLPENKRLVLIGFSIDDPIYTEYALEFYVFKDNLPLIETILATFRLNKNS